MAAQYFRQMFGPAARAAQGEAGSRAGYAVREAVADGPDLLTRRELDFIAARDSFYLGSITPTGWPYIQHRGGPPGFLHAIGPNRLGFVEQPGNRQFITQGNLQDNDRVALFLIDQAARRRLKLIGHARGLADGAGETGEGPFVVIEIDVIGLDWNCPQFITPRFTREEAMRAIAEGDGTWRAR
ncbi:MAG: pyridoxamine 5'-phosphate oxidase family protein [Sphingomonadales bacterium]|nr:pyridoxamine 5'-phosphate oxidase family protein [Sphingomonadales bacterium]